MIRHCLELDSFVRIDCGQILKWRETLIFRWLFTINLQQLDQLGAAAAAPGFTVNPHAVTQGETANNFGGYKNILRRLHEVALRVAQKSETLARNFNDTFAEFRFGLNLFAIFGSWLSSLSRACGRSVEGLDISNRTGRIGINWRRIWRRLRVVAPEPIVPASVTFSRETTARAMM